MVALTLDACRIRRLVDERFGGSVAKLALALPLDRPPDRSTVNRGSPRWPPLPQQRERVCALAGALDVDPVSLRSFDPTNFGVLWPKIVRATQTGRGAGLLKALSFMRHYTQDQDQWPPDEVARRFHGRAFTVFEFAHDPRRRANFYQHIVLTPHRRGGPMVWHLASVTRPRCWPALASVRLRAGDRDRVLLFSDRALARETSAPAETKELTVQTWEWSGRRRVPGGLVASVRGLAGGGRASGQPHRALRLPGGA